jgi:crotonobetainyl-CoA:carnitine CoA-transferase CaiB-like acyl-CoA transferase
VSDRTGEGVASTADRTYLGGIRVVELADEQGEFCGRVLASLGADVIKVEPPGGSPTRRIGPFEGGQPDADRSLYFWHYNLGKRSVIIDVESDAGRDEFRDLVGSADVLLESCPPGYLEDLGLGYENLAAVNPGLVHASITPFGRTGPWAHYQGSDLVHLALGGEMTYCGYNQAIDGRYDTPPIAGQMWQAYHMAGDNMAIGILGALLSRGRTGFGQQVDVAVHQVAATNTELDVLHWIYARKPMSRSRTALSPTKDGRYLYTLYASPMDAFAKVVGMLQKYGLAADLAGDAYQDPSYLIQPDVGVHIQAIVDRFTGMFKYPGPWLEAQEEGILWAPMRKPEENIEDPHWLSRQTYADVDHPELGRSVRYQVGRWYSEQADWAVGRPPTVGEHTSEVRTEVREKRRSPELPPLDSAPRQEFPLQGVRLLDGTWQLASAGGSRYLAALGAEVIRFEWKGSPDLLRIVPPPIFPLAPTGGRAERQQATAPIQTRPDGNLNRNGYFNDISAGRRGMSLNMRHPKGKELFERLLAVSDVYAEGYTATTMERWGLPFERMLKINPRLVYCQQPGFGYHGQYRTYKTVGPIANALSGLTEMVGLPEPYPPAGWGYSYSDWTGAYNLALAMLAGLQYQRRTGRGVWIDASQVESGIAYTGTAYLDKQLNGRTYHRTGNRSPHKPAAPHGAYRCQGPDRWLAVSVFSEEEWDRFRAALGHPPWADKPEFATLAGRIEHQDELDDHVEEWSSTQDVFEAMDLLQKAGVRAGACQLAEDRVDHDPQLAHLGWLVELPHTEMGTWPVREVPIHYGRDQATQGGSLQRGAPCYAEDNDYVLGDILGLSKDEIEALADEGAI